MKTEAEINALNEKFNAVLGLMLTLFSKLEFSIIELIMLFNKNNGDKIERFSQYNSFEDNLNLLSHYSKEKGFDSDALETTLDHCFGLLPDRKLFINGFCNPIIFPDSGEAYMSVMYYEFDYFDNKTFKVQHHMRNITICEIDTNNTIIEAILLQIETVKEEIA